MRVARKRVASAGARFRALLNGAFKQAVTCPGRRSGLPLYLQPPGLDKLERIHDDWLIDFLLSGSPVSKRSAVRPVGAINSLQWKRQASEAPDKEPNPAGLSER
jgi:hypothetical protein